MKDGCEYVILQQDLISIVEQASTIAERLSGRFVADEMQQDEEKVDARLQRWCQVVTKGNQEQFVTRLALDGLDWDRVRRALGSVRLADDQPLPAWIETLDKIIQAAAAVSLDSLEKGETGEYRFLAAEDPVPFEEALVPFIQVARQQLLAQTGSSYHQLTEAAHIAVERSLLQVLSALGSQTLELEFSIFRAGKQSVFDCFSEPSSDGGSRNLYQEFVRGLLAGGLLSLFQEYSVLARLWATVTDFWLDATCEFLLRLEADWSDIQQTFQAELGQVVTIQLGLSDRHKNGRSVIALTFASGLKLIYKPKNLGLEETYFQLLAYFNEQGAPLPFKTLKVINRSTYGWVEYVENLPCQDQEAARRYYQRAGMLVCLIYALEGTDCHYENLIACEEHPVLVDMETLAQPLVLSIADQTEKGAGAMTNKLLCNSVLRTALLPTWQVWSDGRSYDLSGLGGLGEQDLPLQRLKWNQINTDNMVLSSEYVNVRSQVNVPSLEGVSLSSADYVDDIVDGFAHMYCFLMEHRDTILTPDSPLAALGHQQIRFIFRNTRTYSAVLSNTLNPKYLRHGADRSIELDILSRALLSFGAEHPFWPLLRVELESMNQMDVPYFAAYSDSAALSISPNQTIERCFKEPSYYGMISRLQQLSDRDLAQQIAIIRSSLYLPVTGDLSDPLPFKKAYLNLDTTVPLNQEQIVCQAVALAQDLRQRAICSADGSATWIGLKYVPEAQRFQLQEMGYSLYDGSCGLVLFLAALEAVTGDNEFHDLTLGALHNLSKVLQNSDPKCRQKVVKEIGIGGAMGLGSILYALVQISQLLREPALLEDAKQAASLITLECIAADQKFDFISGAAGAILGLLALHKATADPAILAQAITCGHHLLTNRTTSNSGPRAWSTLNGKLITGFSHGAAGIAYALLRLYDTTRNPVFLEAAMEAIAYERSVFSPEAENWSDFRGEKPSFVSSWCHGASGICLARLGGLSVLDTCEIRQEIEVALKTTQQVGLQGEDSLCCGNFGRIEVLLIAAQKLSCPELLETAKRQASWLVARARQTGSFQLFPNLPRNLYPPNFFLGAAGIGYELLRLEYPELLPSVLLWE